MRALPKKALPPSIASEDQSKGEMRQGTKGGIRREAQHATSHRGPHSCEGAPCFPEPQFPHPYTGKRDSYLPGLVRELNQIPDLTHAYPTGRASENDNCCSGHLVTFPQIGNAFRSHGRGPHTCRGEEEYGRRQLLLLPTMFG